MPAPVVTAARFSEVYGRLWLEKYAVIYDAERAAEKTRREEDFVEGPRPVGPWLLRPLTAYDLLICDGYECPLTAGEEAALACPPEQLWWFAWLMQTGHEVGDAEAREAFIAEQRARHIVHVPRRRFLRRAVLEPTGRPTPAYFADLAAVVEFVERHFADSAAPKKLDPKTGQPTAARESGTHWLAGLVWGLACATGWTEQAILAIPLGRLWQYIKEDERRNAGGKAADFSRSKRLRSQCLKEAGEIIAAEAAATPAQS